MTGTAEVKEVEPAVDVAQVAPSRLPRLAIAAAVGWVALYAAGVALVHRHSVQVFQSDVLYSVPDLVGAVLAARAYRRLRRAERGRAALAWRWLAISCALSSAGDLVFAGYYYLAGRPDVFPSWADPLWLLSEVAVVPTMIYAFGRVTLLRRWRSALDALVAALGLGSVLWVLVVSPELGGQWTWGGLVTVSYPVLDLSVLVVLLSSGLGGHRSVPVSVRLLAAGGVTLIVTDLTCAYVSELHAYVAGSWIDIGWQTSAVLTCLAALAAAQLGRPTLEGARHHGSSGRHTPADGLLIDRDVTGLTPLFVGMAAVLAVVGVQVVTGHVSRLSLALAGGSVAAVLVRLLLSIADQRGVSRQLDTALAEQQRLAITDVLTDMYNRRFIEELLRLETSRADRERGRLAVVLLDLDHFKAVNDTYGHQAGDAVLAESALRISRGLRASDVLGRWGGEEFLVVLRTADGRTADEVAERACRELAAHSIRLSDGQRVRITASAGIACLPDNGTDADSLLWQADQALYAAKQAGRNRVHRAIASSRSDAHGIDGRAHR